MQDPQYADGIATVTCAECGESLPRDHTVIRADLGRVCWFCSSELDDPSDRDWSDDTWDEDDVWDL
ncbi:MAG: hypothetical protein QNJ98_14745 [Planctomycetota bacterium]|nr:hypothetical protein [Planctomycetota bacterium]